jgi:hypothetical protein
MPLSGNHDNSRKAIVYRTNLLAQSWGILLSFFPETGGSLDQAGT